MVRPEERLLRQLRLALLVLAKAVLANEFPTDYVVLLPEARGVIPNAYGPVQAKVSSDAVLTLQFNLARGQGYGAGSVTATTESYWNRIFLLKKDRQTCRIWYDWTGAVNRLQCSTRKRSLHAETEIAPAFVDGPVDLDGTDIKSLGKSDRGGRPSRRRLEGCFYCIRTVADTLSSGIQKICGARFSRLVPAPYKWVTSAAAALCALRTKVGRPRDAAYRVCRCCADDSDCPGGACGIRQYPSGHQVCCDSNSTAYSYAVGRSFCTQTQEVGESCDANEMCRGGACLSGVCRAEKLAAGEPCPDREDEDCANGRCGRSSFPSGDYVCCSSNEHIFTHFPSAYYCTGQGDGSACFKDEMCASRTCSGLESYDSSWNSSTTQRHCIRAEWDGSRPTGGGTYPYLVVVRWYETRYGESDPRVSSMRHELSAAIRVNGSLGIPPFDLLSTPSTERYCPMPWRDGCTRCCLHIGGMLSR
jgi:hypothetical protein